VSGLLTAANAITALGPAGVIATGCTLADTPAGQVETILCAGRQLSRIARSRLPIRPCGTGDLLTGLLAAQLAKGASCETAVRHAVDTVFAVLARTHDARSEEMCLIPLPLALQNPRLS